MSWYKFSKKIFVGNCINGLEDPFFQQTIADDATLLAQLIENGQEIDYNQFMNLCDIHPETKNIIEQFPENYKFYYNPDTGIAWYYDINKDVEFFYK